MNPIRFFFKKMPIVDCLKNKIVHNFHITNPNEMNKSFPVDKNKFYEKKNLKEKTLNF